MTHRTRAAVLAGAAAALLAAVAGRSPAEDEWERPFAGTLPRPERGVSVNPPEEGADDGPRVAAFLLDGATGRPVPGASLTLFPACGGTERLAYDVPLARGAADARGVAVVDTDGAGADRHWVADAPGFAPTYHYGAVPPARLLLRRGTDVTGRVLDPVGRPVEGAVVDIFPGCSHSAQVRAATTGRDGTFTLRAVVPDGDLQGCVRTPAGRCGFEQGFGALGRRPVDIALRTSIRVRGRFVDDEKRPVAGVVVRGIEFRRWPVAVSAEDGTWELASFLPGDTPILMAPGEDVETDFPLRERIHAGDVAKVVRIDRDSGAPADVGDDAAVDLRAVLDGGGAPPEFDVLLVRLDDGYETWATLGAGEADATGAPSPDVRTTLDGEPSGGYEFRPRTPFEPVVFSPVGVRLAALAWTRVDLTVRPAPTLRVEGDLPVACDVTLVVPGGELEWDDDTPLAEWRPHLPAAGEACLRIRPDDHPLAYFVPVGPAADGVRTARVAIPEPHRIAVRGLPGAAATALRCDGHEVASSGGADGLWTYAHGPMTLDVTVGDDTRCFRFDLGAEPCERIVDWEDGLSAPDAGRVVVTVPEGGDVSVRVEGRGFSIAGGTEASSEPPCRIVVTRPGHQPFDGTFTEPAEIAHRWGPCVLRVLVLGPDGAPAPAVVSVDGVLHWTREGVLELAGLTPGGHDVIVDPVADGAEGAELRVVLREGEPREREVRLRATR